MGAVITGCLAATIASAAGRPTVVIIKSSSVAPFDQALQAISEDFERDPLRPEQSIQDLEGDEANIPRVLAEIRRIHPSLVITVGSLATAAALKEPAAEPLVFSMVLYPRQSGFTGTSGKQVTGVSLDMPLEVEFDYLRRLFPWARRVGVLYHPWRPARSSKTPDAWPLGTGSSWGRMRWKSRCRCCPS